MSVMLVSELYAMIGASRLIALQPHAALLLMQVLAAFLPKLRRCMPVSWLRGASRSDRRPENQSVGVWETCTRMSNLSSSFWHSRHGVAQPRVPSHSWRYTQMSAPSFRLTQLTIWCGLTPCTLACRIQRFKSLQSNMLNVDLLCGTKRCHDQPHCLLPQHAYVPSNP